MIRRLFEGEGGAVSVNQGFEPVFMAGKLCGLVRLPAFINDGK